MRRADRLLQIIQILRRSRGPIAASRIAEELEVSLRTLYRDMVSLESTGVPVRGEAGVGYVLEDGFDMPPLMFTATELEALMLGARLVDGKVDDALSRAAKDAIAKIAAVVPTELRESLIDAPLFAPNFEKPQAIKVDMADIRLALRQEREVALHYRALSGEESQRVVWPILISFFKNATVLAAWCTKRNDFRTFRLDGIVGFEIAETKIGKRRKTLFAEWRKSRFAQYDRPSAGENEGPILRGV